MDTKIVASILGIIASFLGRFMDRFKNHSEKIDIAIRQDCEICRRHQPLEIMHSWGGGWWKCPKCGSVTYTGMMWSSGGIGGKMHPWSYAPPGIYDKEDEMIEVM